mmetsp:Transcript_3583/g.2171  ORF Transcript_3583/g.2171 Transcript_3583/m.2171 type:complete len:89 (-) Transcript_3583:279-545(-)
MQTYNVFRKLANRTSIRCSIMLNQAESGTAVGQVLVATPGTLHANMRRNKVNVEQVKVFVVDEADTMFDTENLGTQTTSIKNKLPENV